MNMTIEYFQTHDAYYNLTQKTRWLAYINELCNKNECRSEIGYVFESITHILQERANTSLNRKV